MDVPASVVVTIVFWEVPPKTLAEYRKWAELRIDALNHALRGLPQDRTRYHICWGSWNGPHTNDVAFKDIADLVLRVNVGGYSLEMANPRHEHEWRVWETVKLPEGPDPTRKTPSSGAMATARAPSPSVVER